MFPPFPQNLTARAVSNTEIELSWQAAGDSLHGIKIVSWQGVSIYGYRVERSETYGNGDFHTIATVTTTDYQDKDVQPGKTYYYLVSAIIGSDYSGKIGASAKTTPAPPPFPTRLTQQQAIQIAAAFCQSIGNPMTATACDTATAEYRVVDSNPGRPIMYWQPRWKVVFENQAEVDIVDATSAVSLYKYDVPERNEEKYRLAGDAIVQDNAIQYAQTALLATRQTEELAASPTAQELQLSSPAFYSAHYWSLEWQRQSQGIPYRDQRTCIWLQAETGQVRSIDLIFPTPSVDDVSIILSQQQASEIAQRLLVKENITYIKMYRAETEIVQPNSFWQDRNWEPLDTPIRVAWTFRFSGSDATGHYVYEVWVDAQTGGVIGGSTSFMPTR